MAPRHHVTTDSTLQAALELWQGCQRRRCSLSAACGTDEGMSMGSPFLFAYLRGALPAAATAEMLDGTCFGEMQSMPAFGERPFNATLYASSAEMQTNLHADEHGGFLLQVLGQKR
eukprot:1320180-Amphidinium_carterae.1